MNAKTFLATALVLVAASGCATYVPVPKDYVGPTATLRDSGVSEDAGKARLYAAVQVDGQGIANAFSASAMASHGRGNNLSTVYPERKLKASATRVKLKCGHATGAPIAAMAGQIAGTFFEVEGVVDFVPVADARYVVKGELAKERSSCWIEDESTGKPATTVVAR